VLAAAPNEAPLAPPVTTNPALVFEAPGKVTDPPVTPPIAAPIIPADPIRLKFAAVFPPKKNPNPARYAAVDADAAPAAPTDPPNVALPAPPPPPPVAIANKLFAVILLSIDK
jgi:hypothetical protein